MVVSPWPLTCRGVHSCIFFAIKFGLTMVRLLQETDFPASLHKHAPSVMRRDVASGDRVRLPHIYQSSVCGRYIPTSLSTLPI
jgi:hypothetical protein